MALISTLGSPGIEIREVDNSYRPNASTASTVYIPGFAAQGPVDEVISISSVSDFELIYGKPTNAAERYFYHTVKAVLDRTGASSRVFTSRLPYGSGEGDTISNAYTLLAYPAVPVIKKKYENGYLENDQFVFDLEKLAKVFTLKENNSDDNLLVPFELTYDFLVDDVYVNSESMLSSVKINHNEGEKLPSLVNSGGACPTLSFILNSTEGNITVTNLEGKIAVEKLSGNLLVHLAYTLYDNEMNKMGTATFSAKYDASQAGFDSSIYSFPTASDTDAMASAKFCEAFEIAKSFNGQSKDQLNGWDITTPWEEQKNPDGTVKNAVEEDSSNFSSDVTYVIGAPVTFQVSLNEYYKIITGEYFAWSNRPYSFETPSNWDAALDDKVYESMNDKNGSPATFGLIEALGHSAFIVINSSRSTVNEDFEGFYMGITDNMFVKPSDDYIYNAVNSMKITTEFYDEEDKHGLMDNVECLGDFSTIGQNRLSFYLDNNYQGSISRFLSQNVTSMDISSKEYDDTINLALFKISKSATTDKILKLNYSVREKYNWSFGKKRIKSTSQSTIPVSYFAENVMEDSANITIMMNPYVSNMSFSDYEGNIHGKMRVLGDKLVDNLEYFEDKYLKRTYTESTNVSKNSLISPIRLAANNINSYKNIISQAGVSPYILHKNFTTKIGTAIANDEYAAFCPLNSIYPFGTYTTTTNTSKIIGQVPAKLKRALDLVKNDEQYPDIDLLVEGGLGTIYVYSNGNDISGEYADRSLLLEGSGTPNSGTSDEDSEKELIFDDSLVLTGIEDMRTGRSSLSDEANAVIEDYLSVQNVFLAFANSMANGGRGDTFFISDVLRGILIKGANTKITSLYGTNVENNAYDFGETVVHSFQTSVFNPLNHLFDTIVSTYDSTYVQWVKVLDTFSSEKVWVPVSGFVAGEMLACDAVYGPWYATAGLRRGVISGVLDYAISPDIEQRTSLYKICLNSIPNIPNYGLTIYGLRTMSKKDSAFDQNTCRRTFLYMEKKAKQALRYYLFEPNNSYTRLQITNDLDPFFEGIQIAGGIYSYRLICDTSINTPDVINSGTLALRLTASPTRTAENIVMEFQANKYTDSVTLSESV